MEELFSQPTEPIWLSKLSIANFRRFDQLTVQLPQPGQDLVIYGPSGSGKTQICWALLLFLRAHNSREIKSKHATAPFITLTNQAEVSQLLTPSLKGMASWTSLVRESSVNVMDGYPHAVFTGRFSDGTEISCRLRVNGVLQLDIPDASVRVPSKIAFAFAVPATFSDVETNILGMSEAIRQNDLNLVDACLNNFGRQTRGLYDLLPKPSQQAVQNNLSELFGPTSIQYTNGALDVTQNGVKLEAMFYGAAFQKVLSTLILLEFLAEQQNRPIKFLIVEEPEAMLHSALVEPFWAKLRNLCDKRKISLITTTHNAAIIASARNKLPLSSKIAGNVMLEDCVMKELGIDLDERTPVQRSLLFVEGSDDKHFIAQYFKFDNLLLDETQPKSRFAGVDQTDFNFVVRRVIGGKMIYLLDRDFAETNEPSTAASYTWKLPMIESYLILSQLLSATIDQRQALLKTYFELPEASDKFFHKVYQTIPKNPEKEATRSKPKATSQPTLAEPPKFEATVSSATHQPAAEPLENAFEYMQRRMQAYVRVSSSALNADDAKVVGLFIVVVLFYVSNLLVDYLEFIEGHLWVEKVVKTCGKSTAAWIKASPTLHPSVVEMLRTEAADIAALLNVNFELK